MVKPLKDKFGIEVSENTIRRVLQKHEYYYIGPKIFPKNTWKEQQTRLDWWRRHLNKYWHNIFSPIELKSMLIILQVINGWRKMKSILNINNKRRDRS